MDLQAQTHVELIRRDVGFSVGPMRACVGAGVGGAATHRAATREKEFDSLSQITDMGGGSLSPAVDVST